MKKKIFALIVCACLLIGTVVSAIPVSADGGDEASAQYSVVTATEYNAATYYYDRINPRAQICYNYLKEYYDNMPDEVAQYEIDVTHLLPEGYEISDLCTDLQIAHNALVADDPLYRCGGEFNGTGQYYDDDGTIHNYIYFRRYDYHSTEAMAVVDARVKQIVDTVGEGDRYTKLRKLATYCINEFFYDPYTSVINYEDFPLLNGRGLLYNSYVYGAFVKNIAVCGGFAEAFKVICNELDIPCIIVGNASHAWNLVQMDDGGWYRVDITNSCRMGWDGKLPQTLEEYFDQIFLNNNTLQAAFGLYDDPYMLGINNVRHVTDFPPHTEGQYKYMGDTTDFSYTEAPLDYDFGDPQFIYSVNKDGLTCTIIDYAGRQSGDLIIPEEIDGYIVTAIDGFAFYYCTGFDGKLVIPKSVKWIGKAAFAGCYNLTAVEMMGGVLEAIGEGEHLENGERFVFGGTFVGCKGIKEVVLPDSLVTLYKNSFYDCEGLESVSFGAHIESIEEDVFYGCSSSLVLKAPSGSCAESYAAENGLLFEENDRICSFESVDGEWYFEDDTDVHYQLCKDNARINVEAHTGGDSCGDKCDICLAEYCDQIGTYSHVAPYFLGEMPATCIMPEYTGSLTCRCGVTINEGEYIGESDPDNHPDITEEWGGDGAMHFKQCTYCWNLLYAEQHYGGEVSSDSTAICVVCGICYVVESAEETEDASSDETEIIDETIVIDKTTEIDEKATEDEDTTAKQEIATAEPKDPVDTAIEEHTSDEGVSDSNASGCNGSLSVGCLAIMVEMAFVTLIFKKNKE